LFMYSVVSDKFCFSAHKNFRSKFWVVLFVMFLSAWNNLKFIISNFHCHVNLHYIVKFSDGFTTRYICECYAVTVFSLVLYVLTVHLMMVCSLEPKHVVEIK
jgi:hypothetical protein